MDSVLIDCLLWCDSLEEAGLDTVALRSWLSASLFVQDKRGGIDFRRGVGDGGKCRLPSGLPVVGSSQRRGDGLEEHADPEDTGRRGYGCGEDFFFPYGCGDGPPRREEPFFAAFMESVRREIRPWVEPDEATRREVLLGGWADE